MVKNVLKNTCNKFSVDPHFFQKGATIFIPPYASTSPSSLGPSFLLSIILDSAYIFTIFLQIFPTLKLRATILTTYLKPLYLLHVIENI